MCTGDQALTMRFLLAHSLLLHAAITAAQPDPFPDIRVNSAAVSPAHPTTSDTLTITYRFVAPSVCRYIRDWTIVSKPGMRRQLHVRVTRPPHSICTADKEALRTETLRVPPLPAGDYQLMMRGNRRLEGHQFRHGGAPVLFTVREQ